MSARDIGWMDDEEAEISFILGVLTQGQWDSTDLPRCVFCDAIKGEQHQVMRDHSHECIVETAGKLIRREL